MKAKAKKRRRSCGKTKEETPPSVGQSQVLRHLPSSSMLCTGAKRLSKRCRGKSPGTNLIHGKSLTNGVHGRADGRAVTLLSCPHALLDHSGILGS